MEGTFFAVAPTLVAVIAALITKEVFISLFVGLLTGALMIGGGNPITAFYELFNIMALKTGADFEIVDGEIKIVGLGNVGVLIFILELGIIVALMNKSGGTAAFGKFLTRRIKTQRGALLATTGLGCMIFMDDYFNRLAVGSIMRPVADKHGISRIRLAYIIGSVSVSICILIPISSWASAITGNIGESLTEGEPFDLYLKTLLCNFYPILTLAFLFISPILGIEPIGMSALPTINSVNSDEPKFKGKAIDLILPIFALIALSVGLMLFLPYTSETTLVMSGAFTIILCLILYLPRKVMTLKEFVTCIGDGFKSVGDVMIILVFAWTLTGVCERLNVAAFIGGLASEMGGAQALLPSILFVVAMGTAFSTGTAWGTFGMLVPLTVPMFDAFSTMQILSIAAVLSGSVFGNQVSPISDSTLLASSVCECDQMKFIKAQLPGAMIIAFIAFCGFLISGITQNIRLGYSVISVLFVAFIVALKVKKTIQVRKNAPYVRRYPRL